MKRMAIASMIALVVAAPLAVTPALADTFDFSGTQYEDNFRDVVRDAGINAGMDLGGTGHTSLNFTGAGGSGGRTWMTVYDTTPGDTSPATENTFGDVCITADVLIHPFNNSKGAGVVALFNDPADLTGRGLALLVFDAGNTDRLVLARVDQFGRLDTLTSVPLRSGIAENTWYRLTLDLGITPGTPIGSTALPADVDEFNVQGTLRQHEVGSDPNSAVGTQIGTTLSYAGRVPDHGFESAGQIGVIASAQSAVVDSSVTNFQFTPGTCAGPTD